MNLVRDCSQTLRYALVVLMAVGFGAACPSAPVLTCEAQGNCPVESQGGPPIMYVSPAFGLAFDCTSIGCHQTRQVFIENRGGGVLSVVKAALSDGTSVDFSLQSALSLPVDLAAGQSVVVSVLYQPQDAQTDTGLLSLLAFAVPEEGAVAGLVEIPIRVRQSGEPVLSLLREGETPDAFIDLADEDDVLNFGYVEGGTLKTIELIVANNSEGNAILELYNVLAGESFDPAFYVPPLDADQHLINAGESTRVSVQLLPGSSVNDLRLYDSEIWITSNDPVQPQRRVRLFGTAKNVPVLDVQPTLLDFGSTRFQTPKTAHLTVLNGGGVDLIATPTLVGGANVGFALAQSGEEMPPIGSFSQADIDVVLNATTGGAVSGVVRIDSNDPLRPRTDIVIKGFVEAPLLAMEPDPVAFGTLVQGWNSGPVPVELSNVGDGTLTVTGLRMEVGSSTQFALHDVPSLPLQLLPEDPPIVLHMDYTAFTLGPAQALLVAESNSIDYARSEIDVTGTGVTCEQGCALPNANPDCFGGSCAIDSCSSAYHDADGDPKNGCECRQEDPEVGAFCTTAHDVGTIDDSSTTRTGNLHSETDVDMYYFYAYDGASWCLTDDGEVEVKFDAAPPGVEFCLSRVDHQDSGDGCGLGSEQCGLRSWKKDGHCGSDDDMDVTVRVRVTPGANPGCAAYTIRFRSSM